MTIEQNILNLINNNILNKTIDESGEQIFKLSTHTQERVVSELRQNNCILAYLNAPIPTPAKEIVARVFEDAKLAQTEDGDIILNKTNGELKANVVKVKINRIIVQVEINEDLLVQGKALEDVIVNKVADAFTAGINKKFINDMVAQGVAEQDANAGIAGSAMSALKSNNGFVLVSKAYLNAKLGSDDLDKELLNNPKVHLFESNGEAIIIAVEDKNAIEVYQGADEIQAMLLDGAGFLSNVKVFGARASFGFLVNDKNKVRVAVIPPTK